MWQVLRQRQGLDYEPSPATRGKITENLQHIAMFECKPNIKPLDPHLLTEPYEVRAYAKLVRNLSSPDLVLRQKAVAALVQYFGQKTEHIARTLDYGGLQALVDSLSDEDEGVRVQACRALTKMVTHPKAQQAILEQKLVGKLMHPVHDTPKVAVEAFRLLSAMDAHWNDRACTEALIREGCVPLCLEKARTGSDEVKVEALRALSKVYSVKEAFIEVLDNDAVAVLTELLGRTTVPALVEVAAENLASLCFYSAGKRAACRDPTTVVRLLDVLKAGDQDTAVRTATSSALMGITIENRGKELCLENSGCEVLLQCLEREQDDSVLINVMKAVCNISENPAARAKMQRGIPLLQTIARDNADKPPVANSARRAVEMLTWSP
eukprot:RCo030297